MGVAGSGKTTVGSLLASQLGWTFLDADAFHPPRNIAKMRRGISLTDADRKPWLRSIHRRVTDLNVEGKRVVLACSALKSSYRRFLMAECNGAIVYLRGDPRLLRARLDARENHFMKGTMLETQLETLEEPEDAVVIDVAASVQDIVSVARSSLSL